VEGLMGFNAEGQPLEIDPQEDRNRRGVSILLGHLPNAVVRAFADTPDVSKVRVHLEQVAHTLNITAGFTQLCHDLFRYLNGDDHWDLFS
jgi:hypothetical protein